MAGVAHEINTPVGVGVTVASHLRSQCIELMEAFQKGELRKSALDAFERSEFVRDALGADFQRALTEIKRVEQETFEASVTPLEYETCLVLA